MKKPLRMDEVDRYALQGGMLLIAFVVLMAVVCGSGCTRVHVFVERADITIQGIELVRGAE